MTAEITTPRSRRAILGAGLGAVAATVATAVARPLAVRATQGEPVLVGNEYSASHTTGFDTTGAGGQTALRGTSDSNVGVYGGSTSGYGVYGICGSSYGVYGQSDASDKAAVLGVSQGSSAGVQGYSGSNNPPAAPAKTGVYGYAAQDATSVGVRGTSTIGSGVVGKTASGTGVTGTSTSGVGIRGTGGTGRGGVFSGHLAQLRLSPSSAASHPHTGAPGDLFVDTLKRLWFCKGATTWKQIA